jgi:hypothetical protein
MGKPVGRIMGSRLPCSHGERSHRPLVQLLPPTSLTCGDNSAASCRGAAGDSPMASRRCRRHRALMQLAESDEVPCHAMPSCRPGLTYTAEEEAMKLHAQSKRLTTSPIPASAAEYRELLNDAASAITGTAPGDPAHEAIVNPRRGRPVKVESRASVLMAVRLPGAAAAAAARRKAQRQHRTLHAAIREAVTAWALA